MALVYGLPPIGAKQTLEALLTPPNTQDQSAAHGADIRTFLLTTVWFLSTIGQSLQEGREEHKKQRPSHIACLPPNRECTIDARGVSPTERELILKTHNDYRSMVAMGKIKPFPEAKNMQQLHWDEELASVAQAKADQCTPDSGKLMHDKPEDRFTTKFKSTGHNLAFRATSARFNTTNWPGQIKAWFDEYTHYPPHSIDHFSPPSGEPTGHFTQVAWATTRYEGCGFVDYIVEGYSRLPYMQLYVCNYASAGNVLSRPVYDPGEVCSACPEGTTCVKDTGLCMTAEAGGHSYTQPDSNRPEASKHRGDGHVQGSTSTRNSPAPAKIQPLRHAAIVCVIAPVYGMLMVWWPSLM
ncbi:scoloptoxin SSD976-like [Dermacentor albipictus]|uniref:scoloptoxin SSD976-like n=1 Tax=Dermacentor albipictus TaxID=60249 RepID=UPI0038FC2BD9